MMFGWFRKKKKCARQFCFKKIELHERMCESCICIECKIRPIEHTEWSGSAYCIECAVLLVKRLSYSYRQEVPKALEDPILKINGRGHLLSCIEYTNKCFHTEGLKNKCVYNNDCEYITPNKIICDKECPMNSDNADIKKQ